MSEEVNDEGATAVMQLSQIMPKLQQSGGAILLMVDKRDVFRLPLVKESSIVGRAAESDLKLDFADVSRRHCRIFQQSGKFLIEDLASSGGTYLTSEGLNEQKLAKPTALSDHDVIRIGQHRFHFILTSEPKAEDFPQLIPVAGGPMLQLTGAVSTVGRSGANVNIADPRVSTKHAIIETFGKGSIYVIDLGSANGTTVNDEKVAEPKRVDEHDVVGFAGIKYRVAVAGLDAKTMIGVVSAPASADRPVVGTGTLRFDEDRQRVIEALSNDNQNLMETQQLPATDTSVGKRPNVASPSPRSTTGTYTGPHPLAQAKASAPVSVAAPTGLQAKLAQNAMALRIAGGVVLLALLLYPYVLTVSGECRLTPGTVQKARAPMQGRIEKVLVVEGQHVNKGDVLLRFADRDLQYELQKAQTAQAEEKRAKRPNSTSIEHYQREIERVQSQLDLTVVKAGIDGKVVTQAPQDLTNTVVATGQELIEIDDTRKVIAEVLVPEGDIGDVALGQKVYTRVYTDTTESYESEVSTIMPVAEKSMLGSVVVVKAPISNEDERLIPGTTGVAKIISKRHMGIVLLFKKVARIFK